ncbi:MAG: penicillin-insensitive murein endopeptidase [Hyphomicrobiaceae bacterium]|nr:penicillin-insensitive murein endopeptidase [Hyphomicrobiaceae bacterium]
MLMRTTVALAAFVLAAAPGWRLQAQTASTPAAEKASAATTAKALTGPAKNLFGAAKAPAPLAAEAIGFYARGCLAGAKMLATDGPAWQAMRLSRNRNWGHPRLIATVERLAGEAQEHDGWPGLLVGDISQPRGGPMLTGHASHQVGLDADIWLTAMPDRRLTGKEREELSAISMLGPDKLSVDPSIWTDSHVRLIKRAASYPEVDRIFVHPAIKKALCDGAAKAGPDRGWLGKVRPYWGHHYHFHVRMGCPRDSASCRDQPPPPSGDGCGKEVADWLSLIAAPPKPAKPAKPARPKPPLTLAQLPGECRVVLETEAEPEAEAAAPRPVPAVRTKAAQQ